ncbi:MAG: hypothetical protein ACTHLL_07000 [Candidatus Nitrosocosmicus sp.]
MEFVKETVQKYIIIFQLDMQKDKKDVLYARFYLMKIDIIVAFIKEELDHFEDLGEKT